MPPARLVGQRRTRGGHQSRPVGRTRLRSPQPSAGVVFYFLLGIAGVILVGTGGLSLARSDSFRDLFTPGPRPASVETVPESLVEILMLLCGTGCLALASWIWHQNTMPQQLGAVALRVPPARLVYAIILLVSRSLFVVAFGLFLALLATSTVGNSGLVVVGLATVVLIGAIAARSVCIAFRPFASLPAASTSDRDVRPQKNESRDDRQSTSEDARRDEADSRKPDAAVQALLASRGRVLEYLRAIGAGSPRDKGFERQSLTALGLNSIDLAEILLVQCRERGLPEEAMIDFLRRGSPEDRKTAVLLKRISTLSSLSDGARWVLLSEGVVGDGAEVAPFRQENDSLEWLVKHCDSIERGIRS